MDSEETTVLFVAEDPTAASGLSTVLNEDVGEGSVETATSVGDGLDRLAVTNVDCLVSEYDLPDRNGLTFLETVRETHGDLPFILYTADADDAIVREVIAADVTDYVPRGSRSDRPELLAERVSAIVDRHRTRDANETRDDRFRTLLEQPTERLAVLDEDGGCQFATPGMKRLLGDEFDPPRGACLFAAIHPDDRDRARSLIDRATETSGAVIEGEYRHRREDGSYQWVESAVTNPPEIDGIVVSSTDITARKQCERDLEWERDQFTALFENLQNPVVYGEIDDTGPTVDQVNRAFEETFGYDAGEIVGENLDDLIVPETHRREAARINKEILENGRAHTEVTRRTADGPQEFVLNVVLLSSEDGTQNGYAIYTDISEHKERERELRETTRQLQAVLNTVSAIILMKDATGQFLLMNDTCRERLGLETEPVVGMTDKDILPDDIAAEYQTDDQRVLDTGEPLEVEEEIPTVNGRRTYLTRKNPIFDDNGDPYAVCAVSTDITEHKEREAELERKNERLDEFTSIVSHDLRNPLNIAQSYLELARSECTNPHLEDVAVALERIHQIVERTLTLARDGRTIGETVSVDLQTLATDCWDGVDTASATLRVAEPPTVTADPQRLRHLFENLFRNAVEHGGTDVTVRVGALEDGFYVEDDGYGFPGDGDGSRLQPAHSMGGSETGLGLAIVKRIADAHGWDVRATTSADGGARIEIDGVDIDA
ncbi:PAS domain S-box protein [Natrinema sp. 74]|uniref:PAS domain S-box protein n=1 Tax=Natrinema sp. 74 TaxID=3384159 RepID=UPI0038D47BFA